MSEDNAQPTRWSVDLPDEAATLTLAQDLASLLKPGDRVTLTGDLGAGKTTFARALIRTLRGDPELEAPSPTFTLMQIYDGDGVKVVHADFYRLDPANDLAELGWEEEFDDAVALVEWADRVTEFSSGDRIDVTLAYLDAEHRNARRVTLTGYGALGPRLAAFTTLREFLRANGWFEAERRHLQGDASSRAYETLEKRNGDRAILMISPQRPDGPPIRYGRSYSAIARLAENVKPFVAVDEALRALGVSAPEIYARDLNAGLLLIEDLGRDGVVDENGPIPERYLEAASVLAHLHTRKLPDSLPLGDTAVYTIPPYDLDALLIEVELLLEWYVGHVAKANIASGARAMFVNLWRAVLLEIASAPPTWTLRDYHSPNLIWLPQREGIARVGVIDFQDCVLGHPAYDLASLGQDARVSVPGDLEIKLLAQYARLRKDADENFDMAGFVKCYSILSAQRATKILGIFARLDMRDGKPQYLAHIPRVEAYLKKGLAHPALAELKAWYEANLPALFDAHG